MVLSDLGRVTLLDNGLEFDSLRDECVELCSGEVRDGHEMADRKSGRSAKESLSNWHCCMCILNG